MINFEISTLVDRPIDEVFTFISNPLNMPKWQVMVAKVEQLIPGAIGIGSKFNVKAGMLGRAMEGVMEITDYEPPTKFGFTNRLGPIPFLGDLLGTRKADDTRTDLVFFLRPYVLTNTPVDNTEAMNRLQQSPQKTEVEEALKGLPTPTK